MTIPPVDEVTEELPDYNPYYIVYNPSTTNLMEKIGIDGFSMSDVITFLTGRNPDLCDEKSYHKYLTFDNAVQRKGMLEQLAIECYGQYYIANQICRVDATARVILADDKRRTMSQIISREHKKPLAVFITTISSSFPTACAAAIILNRGGIPVIIGGIHISTSPGDVDTYIRNHVTRPELISAVIGAGDYATIHDVINGIRESALRPEYQGEVSIENGVWGDPRVIELPKMRPMFINKVPVVGPILSRRIDTNVTTPYLGCPFSCSFCSISSLPEKSRRFTSRDSSDFIEELMYRQREGVSFRNRFYFITPDNLLAGGKGLSELLDRMIESPLAINYAAQISIEVADDEKLLRKLRKSGASHFFIGLESLDIRNLELVGKNIANRINKEGTTVEEFYSSRIKRIQEYGISIHGAFMFGMPYDYFNSLDDHSGIRIADFCLRHRIGLQPTCLNDLPGSPDFKESRETGRHLYGDTGTMDYLCSLSIADLTESNRSLPDSMYNSPLVAFYCLFDTIRRVGSYPQALKNAFAMARHAWRMPTATGVLNIKERTVDAFAAMGFQLGASTYLELYHELAHSTKRLKGTIERLYEREMNPEIKKIFQPYIRQFV